MPIDPDMAALRVSSVIYTALSSCHSSQVLQCNVRAHWRRTLEKISPSHLKIEARDDLPVNVYYAAASLYQYLIILRKNSSLTCAI